jgi:hypothetical protein
MSLRATLLRQVDAAFKAAGDLAVDVTLIDKTVTGFDFAVNAVLSTSAPARVIRGIFTAVKSSEGTEGVPSGTLQAELLLKAKDITMPDLYDSVSIAGAVWRVVPPFINDGYTVQLKLARGS